MAFAFRKIISNIGYFKKPGDEINTSSVKVNDLNLDKQRGVSQLRSGDADVIHFERTEPDSTSIQLASSLELPDFGNNFSAKKGSLSDTDLLNTSQKTGKGKRRSKKLKLDIEKANQSLDESLKKENVENTPKHVLLECKSSEIFSERLKKFDFSKSFEIDTEESSCGDENFDIESLSDGISLDSSDEQSSVKMCRKVRVESQSSSEETSLVPAISLESFGDVEIDKNEEERLTLLLNYQMKFEKIECWLKKLLTEFQFHIEVSKIFNSRSFTALPGTDLSQMPKLIGELKCMDVNRGVSPTGSWNIIMEKEDNATKIKLKNQLLTIQHTIDDFLKKQLKTDSKPKQKSVFTRGQRSITFDIHKGKRSYRVRMNMKKKMKHYDFPDIRDAMLNMFSPEDFNQLNTSLDSVKCKYCCGGDSSSETDSGVTTKSEERSMSITSSIGNFSLDSSTLTAYSETLDQIISYNSFQDTSLYSALLQKAAVERLTFYVQVHSIQIKSDTSEDFESKNNITFDCPACLTTETEENGLLKHILSQIHCEKIHFLYKTAYIKKCVQSGKEIQPSTVLNPMKMYRDDNKIVCFGDAMYACSLCFENMIVGESILMAHCSDPMHIKRKEMLCEILE